MYLHYVGEANKIKKRYYKGNFDADHCYGLKGYLTWVDLKETVIMFWTCEIDVLITTSEGRKL